MCVKSYRFDSSFCIERFFLCDKMLRRDWVAEKWKMILHILMQAENTSFFAFFLMYIVYENGCSNKNQEEKLMSLMSKKKVISWLLCMMLIMSMGFATVGCGSKSQGGDGQETTEVAETEKDDVTLLGEGQKMFLFTVVDKDGNETNFEIHTDKETVGDALLDLELITGDEGEFGLYVKSVNGITADYEVDQTYWAFYVNGEYATAGVDATAIEEGTTYSFKVEK